MPHRFRLPPVAPGPDPAERPPAVEEPHLQTRLGTLVLIRWLAIAGQLATIIAVEIGIGGLPLVPVLSSVAASVVVNAALTLGRGAFRRVDERAATGQILFDLIQLTVLVGLTGGLSNPFALFLLAPVTVAAAILSAGRATVIAAAAVVAVTVVGLWHETLPWFEGVPVVLPSLYLFGVWLALQMGIISVAFFTWRMAQESRSIAAAYSESRIALAHEQRLADVGALAAAVAHELNTPLATVHLVARELAADLPQDSPLQTEVRLLIGQTERCRDTLARLTRRRERDAAVELETIAFPALVELAAQPHAEGARVPVTFEHRPAWGAADERIPWVERSPEILHGIGNFVQNAVQFARKRVMVETEWGDGDLTVRIADDGPGFPAAVLIRLGEPYVSTRDEDGSHLGLGVFIAATLLERIGARVSFFNPEGGGARVVVAWRSGVTTR